MKTLLIFFIVVTTGCSKSRTLVESTADSTMEFSDLNEAEKLGVFSEIREEYKGDFRKYLGKNEDSTKVQLVLNNDKRFAIGIKLFFNGKLEDGDSVVTFGFSTTSQYKNLCIGRWTDEGDVIKLKFLLGQSEFFDPRKNGHAVKIVDDKTVLLDKEANGIWISGALCTRN